MDVDRWTIWRFYAYRITVSNGFWLPVGVLYLQRVRGFGLGEVGLVMGAFSVAMVAAEIPTGYVGDRLGRRGSLIVGNVVLATFMAAHTVVESVAAYVALYAFWAFGWTFRSGTADALLYELLAAGGEADQFARFRGRASTVQKSFAAASAIVAGVLVTVDWALPFLANAAVALLGVPILATFPRAGVDADPDAVEDDPFTVREALSTLYVQATRPELRWLVAYSALFSGFYQVVRDFEQPAMEATGVPVATFGLIYAGFKVAGGVAAMGAGWCRDRLGLRTVFAAMIPVYAVAAVGLVVAPLLVVPVLTLNRGLGVLMGPLRRQYVNDRVGDVGRATVLSGVSMVLLLAGGVAKFAAGFVAESIGLLRFFALGGVGVAAVGAVLWVTTSPVRSGARDGTPDGDGTAPAD